MKMVHEEISELLQGWKDNDRATPAQRAAYGHDRKLPRRMLGNSRLDEGRDCIRLLREDGGDGGYVGSVTPITAAHYFYDDAFWPSDRDLFRIGRFFHIGFYQTLALILKSRWEQYLLKRLKEDKRDGGNSIINLIKTYDDTKAYMDEFVQTARVQGAHAAAQTAAAAVDSDALYRMIQSHGGYAQRMGYNALDFGILVRNMLAAGVFVDDITGKAMNEFIQRQNKEKEMLSEKEEDVKKKYAQMKSRWFVQLNVIEELLQKKEEIRRSNAQIVAKWAAEFGEKWTELCRLDNEYYELSMYREEKERNPSCSFEEVKQLVKESIEKKRKQMEEEIQRISRCELMHRMNLRGLKVVGDMSMSGVAELAQEVQKKQAKTLRKIYMLTHPDRLLHKTFTQQQREELLELYKGITQLADQQAPGLPLLEDTLHRAKGIWDNMGVDAAIIDVFPGGDTSDEMLEKAQERLRDLEEKETSIRNELHLLLEDAEVNWKEQDIEDEVSIQRKHKKLDEKINELEHKVKAVRSEIEQYFKEGELAWS